MKTRILILLFGIFSHATVAQIVNLDSLDQLLNSSDEIETKLQIYSKITKALNDQGSINALSYIKGFLSLAETQNLSIYLGHANAAVGRYYLNKNMIDSAYIPVQKAIEIYKTTGENQAQNNLSLYLSDIHLAKVEMDKAKKYILSTFDESKKNNDTLLMAKSLNQLGVFYRHDEKFRLSLETHLKGYKLSKKTEDPYIICNSASDLGYVYTYTLNNEEALYFLRLAESIALKNNFQSLLASCYNRIALVCEFKLEIDTAMTYYNKALSLNLMLDNQLGAARNYHNMAIICEGRQDYQNAELFHLKALKIKERLNDIRGVCASHLELGSVYIRMNKLNKVKYNLDKAYDLARKINNLNYVQISYKYFSEYNAAIGNFKNSYEFSLKRQGIMDTLFNDFTKEAIEGYRVKYETQQKQDSITNQKQEIYLMQQEETIANQKIKNRNILLFSSISLIGILGILYNRILNHRNKVEIINHELTTANEKLEFETNRSGILLLEVQHRVKNNLNFVASLLDLQSIYTKNIEAKNIVEEGRNRVETMGLLHRRLSYKDDSPIVVNMKQYLDELVPSIVSTLSTIGNEEVMINCEPLVIDIEKAMPIGLIINELICNSFKHWNLGANPLEIIISLKKEEQFILVVEDNGDGLPVNFNIQKGTTSFGLKLVEMLCRQLKGHIQITNHQGARFQLVFDA